MAPNDETTPAGSTADPEHSKKIDESSSSTQPFLSVHVPYDAPPEVIAGAIAKALLARDVPPPFFKDRLSAGTLGSEADQYQTAPAAQQAGGAAGGKVEYKALLILVQEEGGFLGSDS